MIIRGGHQIRSPLNLRCMWVMNCNASTPAVSRYVNMLDSFLRISFSLRQSPLICLVQLIHHHLSFPTTSPLHPAVRLPSVSPSMPLKPPRLPLSTNQSLSSPHSSLALLRQQPHYSFLPILLLPQCEAPGALDSDCCSRTLGWREEARGEEGEG
jgi:hypothetical protein